MNILSILIPYALSWIIGYSLVTILLEKETKLDHAVRLFIGGGLGAGISAVILFINFWLLDGWHRSSVILSHVILMAFAVGLILLRRKNRLQDHGLPEQLWQRAIIYSIFAIAFLPLWSQSRYYPLGGWDAWQVWNFKARFLFLAGSNWENIFLPALWRSSPHYPLLLPLFNVWGWSIVNHPTPLVPQLTSLFFTFLTCGLLLAVLWRNTRTPWVIVGPALLLSLPFYGLQAISQYSDIVLSFYFMAGLFCVCETLRPIKASKKNRFPGEILSYTALGGLFLSLAGFTKPEGLVAAGIIALFTGILWLTSSHSQALKIRLFLTFAAALGIGTIPLFIFHFFYSPGNLTFINGLISKTNPVSLYRLKMILAFILTELKSSKWNGLWILLGIGMIVGWRKCWRREIVILPLFTAIYLITVLFYCWINTYFPIGWWLQVSLSRILFSLMPVVVYWIFSSLWWEKSK